MVRPVRRDSLVDNGAGVGLPPIRSPSSPQSERRSPSPSPLPHATSALPDVTAFPSLSSRIESIRNKLRLTSTDASHWIGVVNEYRQLRADVRAERERERVLPSEESSFHALEQKYKQLTLEFDKATMGREAINEAKLARLTTNFEDLCQEYQGAENDKKSEILKEIQKLFTYFERVKISVAIPEEIKGKLVIKEKEEEFFDAVEFQAPPLKEKIAEKITGLIFGKNSVFGFKFKNALRDLILYLFEEILNKQLQGACSEQDVINHYKTQILQKVNNTFTNLNSLGRKDVPVKEFETLSKDLIELLIPKNNWYLNNWASRKLINSFIVPFVTDFLAHLYNGTHGKSMREEEEFLKNNISSENIEKAKAFCKQAAISIHKELQKQLLFGNKENLANLLKDIGKTYGFNEEEVKSFVNFISLAAEKAKEGRSDEAIFGKTVEVFIENTLFKAFTNIVQNIPVHERVDGKIFESAFDLFVGVFKNNLDSNSFNPESVKKCQGELFKILFNNQLESFLPLPKDLAIAASEAIEEQVDIYANIGMKMVTDWVKKGEEKKAELKTLYNGSDDPVNVCHLANTLAAPFGGYYCRTNKKDLCDSIEAILPTNIKIRGAIETVIDKLGACDYDTTSGNAKDILDFVGKMVEPLLLTGFVNATKHIQGIETEGVRESPYEVIVLKATKVAADHFKSLGDAKKELVKNKRKITAEAVKEVLKDKKGTSIHPIAKEVLKGEATYHYHLNLSQKVLYLLNVKQNDLEVLPEFTQKLVFDFIEATLLPGIMESSFETINKPETLRNLLLTVTDLMKLPELARKSPGFFEKLNKDPKNALGIFAEQFKNIFCALIAYFMTPYHPEYGPELPSLDPFSDKYQEALAENLLKVTREFIGLQTNDAATLVKGALHKNVLGGSAAALAADAVRNLLRNTFINDEGVQVDEPVSLIDMINSGCRATVEKLRKREEQRNLFPKKDEVQAVQNEQKKAAEELKKTLPGQLHEAIRGRINIKFKDKLKSLKETIFNALGKIGNNPAARLIKSIVEIALKVLFFFWAELLVALFDIIIDKIVSSIIKDSADRRADTDIELPHQSFYLSLVDAVLEVVIPKPSKTT